MLASFKFKVSFPYSMFDTRGLVKLGMLSGEDLGFSSWCGSLDEKFDVYGRMDLVAYISTDAKKKMRPKTLGVPSLFFFLVYFCFN